jgi:hypothetical protein
MMPYTIEATTNLTLGLYIIARLALLSSPSRATVQSEEDERGANEDRLERLSRDEGRRRD